MIDAEEGDFELSPPWKQVAKDLFGTKYTFGQIVPHEELQTALKLPKPTGLVEVEDYERWRLALMAQIDALSTFLLDERSMCLRAVAGQGYLIVEPAKQTNFAVTEGMKRMRSELRKMGRRLTFIDRTALTSDQAKENADALARLAFLNQQASKARQMKFLSGVED
ncbi:MAG: hypothetical protein V4669_13710 [Pseudomonadota bacterium]